MLRIQPVALRVHFNIMLSLGLILRQNIQNGKPDGQFLRQNRRIFDFEACSLSRKKSLDAIARMCFHPFFRKNP